MYIFFIILFFFCIDVDCFFFSVESFFMLSTSQVVEHIVVVGLAHAKQERMVGFLVQSLE